MSFLPKSKLTEWLENVPDYYDMTKAYEKLGTLKSQVIYIKRDIERAEELVSIENDKPRSNEARSRKLQATSVLKDNLAQVEGNLAIQEALVKSFEYRKSMFASAAYTAKIRLEVTTGDDS
jgi:hypothetical protein